MVLYKLSDVVNRKKDNTRGLLSRGSYGEVYQYNRVGALNSYMGTHRQELGIGNDP